jgi:amino acid adenylation domain-containing protein
MLHDTLLSAGRLTPDHPAVLQPDAEGRLRAVTYRELELLADDYTAVLDGAGAGVGERVIIESQASASAVALLIACSRLGLPFIPVSPETPERRLLSIIEATEPVLYLRTGDGPHALDTPPDGVGLGHFGPAGLDLERPRAARVRHRRSVTSTDAAYMIFTSGSTGRPKGVVMSHRGISSFYRAMTSLGIVSPADRVATTSALQFDFCLLDIGLALVSGATLVPVPREMLRWPRRLLRFLRESGVTQVDGVPSIWRAALRHEPEMVAELSAVRGVLYSGEPFPLAELRLLNELLPQARVTNCFGPTEAMAFSFTQLPNPLPADLERLPIGFAYPGGEMLLIDEDGRPVDEQGVVGEIHMRGPSLFSGYWSDPEGTRRALVPDPIEPRTGQLVLRSGDLAYRGEGGELYFCGRVDSQVKIRGNRIELGEVERRLIDFPGVAAAAAVVRQSGDAEAVLSAFVVREPDAGDHDPRELNEFVRSVLPEYMVPRTIRVLHELPLNPNGKVDRPGLAML